MRRIVVILALALGTLLALSPAASATTPGHDAVGRAVTHVHYGEDPRLEDELGFDCRYDGNRRCGATERQHRVTSARVAACERAAHVIDTYTDGYWGDPGAEWFAQCVESVYAGEGKAARVALARAAEVQYDMGNLALRTAIRSMR